MEPILRIENVTIGYGRGRKRIDAVRDVSLEVAPGETLALVGESGCGKSTLGRAVLGLEPISEGRIFFDGVDIGSLSEREMRPLRKRLQMIFQDSYASLDPRMSAAKLIAEPRSSFGMAAGRDAIDPLMEAVGLSPEAGGRRPAQFSGGQRQRIGIARSLASEPDLIVADEPVSSLDMSVQAQILNLIRRLGRERELAMLFISHDLRAVEYLADRIAVMYLGRIVETGPARELIENAAHPYTKALISAIPAIGEKRRQRIVLSGEMPSPADPPSGCAFRTRCPIAIDACAEILPPFEACGPGHAAACIRLDESAKKWPRRIDGEA